MIRAFNGKTPRVATSAFVSEAAYVVGDVSIGDGSSVWPGAVIRADFGHIRIGTNTHVEDNSTLHHGSDGLDIGDDVTIGHNAVIHCRRIGDATLIGNHATLLDGAEIGSNCLVAAGAVLRPGSRVPNGSFIVGVPAEIRPLSDARLQDTKAWNRYYPDLVVRYLAEGLGDVPPAGTGAEANESTPSG